jgi:hypothetical protein
MAFMLTTMVAEGLIWSTFCEIRDTAFPREGNETGRSMIAANEWGRRLEGKFTHTMQDQLAPGMAVDATRRQCRSFAALRL